MYMIKFVLTIKITLMTVIIYTERKIKALATVAKSKPIMLATW